LASDHLAAPGADASAPAPPGRQAGAALRNNGFSFTGNRGFEPCSLQRRVKCEPDLGVAEPLDLLQHGIGAPAREDVAGQEQQRESIGECCYGAGLRETPTVGASSLLYARRAASASDCANAKSSVRPSNTGSISPAARALQRKRPALAPVSRCPATGGLPRHRNVGDG
jgi:hypothetical protein